MIVCSTCHEQRTVMLTHRLVIGRRTIEWAMCVVCHVAEERAQDARAVMAIEQAESAGA